ncbi:MAG TPA: hypothetical protein ENG65_01285 [Candidatus Bathyarchaeota archaeon]|nr:hypothetical protein [Candidatus Bathyarchaeota archaeon]
MGTIKTTITIDEDLWKKFTLIVIEKYGYRKKNMVIEQLIREFIRDHERPKMYDAIWAFKEDIMELKKSLKERVLMAHLSQPLGKPLHRYVGKIVMEEDGLILSGKDKKTERASEIIIPREKIREAFLGWDDVLRRWRDTRAWIPPLRIRFEDEGKLKTLYVYAKKEMGRIYGRENRKIFEELKLAWRIKSPEDQR